MLSSLTQKGIPILYSSTPPPSKENGFKIPQFLSEFEEFLIHINSMSGKQVILGDFNFHVDIPTKPDVARFLAIIEGAGFCQLVNGPTHKHGHTLYLILARLDDNMIRDYEIGPRLSDHHIISCRLSLKKPIQKVETFTARKFSDIDKESFENDLGLRFKSIMTSARNVDELSVAYEKTVNATLDHHAPFITKTRSTQPLDSLGTTQRYIKLEDSGGSMRRSGGKQDWKSITKFTLNIIKLLTS